jgi:hypothetical protein
MGESILYLGLIQLRIFSFSNFKLKIQKAQIILCIFNQLNWQTRACVIIPLPFRQRHGNEILLSYFKIHSTIHSRIKTRPNLNLFLFRLHIISVRHFYCHLPKNIGSLTWIYIRNSYCVHFQHFSCDEDVVRIFDIFFGYIRKKSPIRANATQHSHGNSKYEK